MKKSTLKFNSLGELAAFSKAIQEGFIINTINYTLTGILSPFQIISAKERYRAKEVETSEKVFSYSGIL